MVQWRQVVFDDSLATHRILPREAVAGVVPVGTILLLRIAAPEVQECIRKGVIKLGSSQEQINRQYENVTEYLDQYGRPVTQSSQTPNPSQANQNASQPACTNYHDYIRVRLNVPPNIRPPHGHVYVSCKGLYQKNMETGNVRGFYVRPWDLRFPTSDEADLVHQSIIIVDSSRMI